MNKPSRRCILGVFAHPDDETSGCAGTIMKHVRDGVDVYIATATRGERGELGTGGLEIQRDDLPAVRESELRAVLKTYGANEPFLLDYKDQELADADFEVVVGKVLAVMTRVSPDVVITFGPTGISHHSDHIAIHRATVEAFTRYHSSTDSEPRLFYVAIPEDIAKEFEMELDESETDLSVEIDISEFKDKKIAGLRMYRSQQDAQDLAEMFESSPMASEWFHQAYPAIKVQESMSSGFWDED